MATAAVVDCSPSLSLTDHEDTFPFGPVQPLAPPGAATAGAERADLHGGYRGVGAVLDQAVNHSEVMKNLAYLSDMIGPRLTGSSAMRKANDWTWRSSRPTACRPARA